MTDSPLVGDILLLDGTAKASAMNRTAQGLLSGRKAAYSHVALRFHAGLIVHAIPGGGVTLAAAPDVLGSAHYAKDFRAVRHRAIEAAIAADPGVEQKIAASIAYYYEQEYNFRITVRKSGKGVDGSSFCSELVAKVYRDLGYPFSRAPEQVLPVDIAHETDGEPWRDVTEIHRLPESDPDFRETLRTLLGENADVGIDLAQLEAILSYEPDRQFAELQKDILSTMRKSTRQIQNTHAMLSAVHDFMRKQGVTLPELQEPKASMKFWDSDPPKEE